MASAELLIVLVWVHPAAAGQAWKTLKDMAQALEIWCTSRSVETQHVSESANA